MEQQIGVYDIQVITLGWLKGEDFETYVIEILGLPKNQIYLRATPGILKKFLGNCVRVEILGTPFQSAVELISVFN